MFESKAHSRRGMFDQAHLCCYHEVTQRFQKDSDTLTAMRRDYDLVVIAMGLWEFISPHCQTDSNMTVIEKMIELLDTIRDASTKDFQIVFRTSGFDEKKIGNDQLLWDMINISQQYFQNISSVTVELKDFNPNITLVDWGSAISKRSLGKKRIRGNISAHYGLEARLLYIQQLMHELIKSDLN